MSITAYENLISTAKRRMLINNEKNTSIRLSDFTGIIPSITGKIELVYEGEEQGADQISFNLIDKAIENIFLKFFPRIPTLQKPNELTEYDDILSWFFKNKVEIFIADEFTNIEYASILQEIIPLNNLINKYCKDIKKDDQNIFKEILIWGLSSFKKLSKNRMIDGIEFKDSLGSYLSNIK